MERKFINFSSKTIIVVTWALLVISIIVDSQNRVFWRAFIWLSFLIISYFSYFKVKSLSLLTNLMISFAILTAIFGELYLQLYYSFEYYDKILHLFNTILIFFVFNSFLRKYIPNDSKKRLKYTVIITIFLVFFWELAEIIFDYFFDSALVGVFSKNPTEELVLGNRMEILAPWLDTLFDLILNMVGIFIAYLITRESNPKKSG